MGKNQGSLCDQHKQELHKEVDSVIKKLGGPANLSRMLKISQPAIQQWKVNGLPELRVLQFSISHPHALEGTRWEVQKTEG